MTTRRIHIVDSDPSAALVTRLGLQNCFTGTVEVSAAPRSLPAPSPFPHHPYDLLIVDPGGQSQSAERLVRTMQVRCPDTPVIVLTAYDSPLLRQQMQQLGVRHYLAKPVELHELERVVRDILALPLTQPATVNV